MDFEFNFTITLQSEPTRDLEGCQLYKYKQFNLFAFMFDLVNEFISVI